MSNGILQSFLVEVISCPTRSMDPFLTESEQKVARSLQTELADSPGNKTAIIRK